MLEEMCENKRPYADFADCPIIQGFWENKKDVDNIVEMNVSLDLLLIVWKTITANWKATKPTGRLRSELHTVEQMIVNLQLKMDMLTQRWTSRHQCNTKVLWNTIIL